MLRGEAELVSEWTGLPGRAKNAKGFDRSNGPDIALYKNYHIFLNLGHASTVKGARGVHMVTEASGRTRQT